jgi:hypothetical protein
MVGRMAVGMRFLLWTSLLLATTSAVPAAVFPFNSQVPTAARINQPYTFQFSGSTFAPGDANLIYSLSGQPAWLSLDSTSRTLTGTPGQADRGSSTFILTAADSSGAAHMQCTLVVSSDPVPILQGDLGSQLAESTNLSSSNPPVMALLPNNAFNFHFRQNSFIDIVQRSLYYYATLTDHTPLPAWLHFDPTQLAFEGVAPLLSAFPQSFDVMLIASDVPGFASSSSTFTIMIGERQLVFVPEEKTVRVKAGEAVAVDDLGSGLLLNGQKMDLSRLKSVETKDLPAWLEFDSKTLKLQGNARDDVQAANVTITVNDDNGDTAMVVVHLVLDGDTTALFTGSIGTLDATPGEHFEYTIPTSVIGNADATLMLVLPTDATWLQFDSGKRELKGEVPTQASSIITATLNARAQSAPEPETQIFKISMKATASIGSSSSATTLVTSRTSPTESPTIPAAVFADDMGSHNGLPGRTIAGIVVGVLLAAAILFAILFVCCRKRRTREGYERHASPSKRTISRPIPPIEANSTAVTTELHRDIEKAVSPTDNERYQGAELPPQIALNLPPQSARNSKWTSRFSRNSLASSLGNGEDMIRADANIPEWGHEPTVLQTPHDSFVPAQMARVSRQLSDTSPSKRAFRRLRAKRARHQSEDDIGLGIGMGDASLSPHRAESRRKVRSLGLEATMERSSCGSLATEATSVLNMRPSDFPRPPTQTSVAGSRFMLAGTEKRKSLRMVARSDSINDDRSLEEKRISFIKKRASTTLSSPLFSASLGPHRRNGHGSTTDVDGTSAPPSRRSKRIKPQLTSYSESSSIQPTRSSNRLSQRIRSTFAPNFPRVITRSTLANDDADSDNWETSSESSSSIDLNAEMELADEMALPRHERSWVLPNEASPTPPPTAPPSNRRPSIHRASTPNSNSSVRRTKPWTNTSSRSISPLAAQALDNASASLSASGKASRLRRSRLSEPMALTSKDSLSKVNAKAESSDRPRLAHTRSGRPVSVEDVQRLSSLRAERVEEEDVGAGALEDDARERVVTDGSGKAFI